MEEIWTEKYRPKSLKEVVGQEEIVRRLLGYIQARNMPHLLFAGKPGTGKTTCALALAKDFYGDKWRYNFLEMNASDERGIDTVRVKVKEYARTSPLIGTEFKIIFLDEADALTSDAQSAMRRIMEMYVRTCRFILSCNYSSKIIEPIQSRCALFRFRPLEMEKVIALLKKVAANEKITLTENGLAAVQTASEGDLRRAITLLQTSAAVSKSVDENVVYEVSNLARPKEVKNMIELALKGNFENARKVLDGLLTDEGVSPEDLVKQIHRLLYEMTIEDRVLVRIIDRLGEIDFRVTEGADPRIQIEAILAYMVAVQKG